MVGFLFYSGLGQHGRLSIYKLGSMVGFVNLGSMVGFLFYSELGQHGRLSILF